MITTPGREGHLQSKIPVNTKNIPLLGEFAHRESLLSRTIPHYYPDRYKRSRNGVSGIGKNYPANASTGTWLSGTGTGCPGWRDL